MKFKSGGVSIDLNDDQTVKVNASKEIILDTDDNVVTGRCDVKKEEKTRSVSIMNNDKDFDILHNSTIRTMTTESNERKEILKYEVNDGCCGMITCDILAISANRSFCFQLNANCLRDDTSSTWKVTRRISNLCVTLCNDKDDKKDKKDKKPKLEKINAWEMCECKMIANGGKRYFCLSIKGSKDEPIRWSVIYNIVIM